MDSRPGEAVPSAAVRLERRESGGIAWWTDAALDARAGVLVAFTERSGGVSGGPYASLNLAAHVGDDAYAVDENRDRLLDAVGLAYARARLITAEQVHGTALRLCGAEDAGAGAFASRGSRPVAATDALLTAEEDIPLALFFADCVPVVLVAEECRQVAVVHAGWRGALAGLPGAAAALLSAVSGTPPEEMAAYVGSHIGRDHYEVGDEVLSQFLNAFGTVSRAGSGGLDLGAVVTADLTGAGVPIHRICRLDLCTAEHTDSFFSYRAEGGLTGRHAALVAVRGNRW